MKNKRKIIIIVVCVIAAAAIAVGASVGYYYSRPERTAQKVRLPCILWTTQKFKGAEKPLTTGLLTHICASGATVLLPINAPKA